jgi:hypothetical protein
MASALITLFQARRLKVAAVPEADVVVKEAQKLSVKITPHGNESFERWDDSDNDDLVLSPALACWAAETSHWPAWPPDGGATRRPLAGHVR